LFEQSSQLRLSLFVQMKRNLPLSPYSEHKSCLDQIDPNQSILKLVPTVFESQGVKKHSGWTGDARCLDNSLLCSGSSSADAQQTHTEFVRF